MPIFQEWPSIAYRPGPTFRDILTSSIVQYPYQPHKNIKVMPNVCRKAVCRFSNCPNISRKDKLVCTQTKLSHDNLPRPTKGYYTCKISNIIYCITCNQCSKQYIGQLSRALCQRIYEHKYSVLNPLSVKIPVNKHFSTKNHGVKDMVFSVVEWFNKDPISSKNLRLKKEKLLDLDLQVPKPLWFEPDGVITS